MDRLKSAKEEDYDWSLDPKILRDVFKRTNFDSIFQKSIAKDVIQILSPQQTAEPHSFVCDEELVYERLISPLERFVCDLDDTVSLDDVKTIFDRIQSLNQPSKVCRRILKAGDVTFACNDCGLDGTCVVCIDCFHKSAHKDHNYRMSNSDGGGCCDCGDTEAWKQNYACTDHMSADQVNTCLSDFGDKESRMKQINNDKKAMSERIKCLPKGMAARYFSVCQASLHYARTLITWENYKVLPESLKVEADNDLHLAQLLCTDGLAKNYFTVLFNDEVHTYDHVINTLVKIIKCTKMTASVMASTVSREGRALVVNDNYEHCKRVKDGIGKIKEANQDPLKVEIIHGSILAHQAFAMRLIEWIQKMSSICDGFRILTAYTLLGGYDPILDAPNDEEPNDKLSLIEKIMLSNTSYWKMPRVDWNELFVTTMLTDYSIKEKFARLITRLYPRLMQDFIQDDHDHAVSILSMTTQLYTVPSLISMLIEEENALTVITQTLIATCQSTKRDNQSFENRHTFDMHGLKRGFYIISDIRHLINSEPFKWTSILRNNVIEAIKIFLNLLNSMQGMDSVKRQLGQHLEYEPDWESGMTLQSRLVHLITKMITYCSYDDEVLVSILKEAQTRLLKNGGYKTVCKSLFDHKTSCIQYDVSCSPVSVHLPLTRFAAALILEVMRRRPSTKVPYDQSLVLLVNQDGPAGKALKYSMIDIMEPSLRTEVMIAQFRSGMWRRNGYSLVNQILYFHGPIMRKEMYDRDILLLQEVAAMYEANEFMIHMVNKFNLFTWFNSDTTREPLVGPKAVSFINDEEVMAQTMSLGEEFLQFLLTIIGERYRIGVGKDINEDEILKHEIIQLLCIQPTTRSDLTQKLCVDEELDCIKSVANLKRSTQASMGKYELKEEFYDRFNPFFYHYTRRHQSNALDAQLKRKRNLKEPLVCCPPPKPVELTSQFRNLNYLLKCDITLILLAKIIRRALGPPEDAQECSTKAPIRFHASDLQLDQSLHLIGLGLWEQERDPLGFRFVQVAYEKEIFSLMSDCHCKAKRSKDLIFWLMSKTNSIIETLISDDRLEPEGQELLLVVRRQIRPVLGNCDSLKPEPKKWSAEMAAQRRERIMAMMKANQDKFMSSASTKQLISDTEGGKDNSPAAKQLVPAISLGLVSAGTTAGPAIYTTRSGRKSKPPKSITSSTYSVGTSGATAAPPAHLLPQETNNSCMMDYESDAELDCQSINMEDDASSEPAGLKTPTNHLCILCRDEQQIGFEQPTMVLLAYIQRSSVLSKNRHERRIPNYALTPSNQLRCRHLLGYGGSRANKSNSSSSAAAAASQYDQSYSFTSDNSLTFDATFMPADLFFGPHVSTCGHVMHFDCWLGFFNAIVKRETSRPGRNARHVSFELERQEILCPLCECISNATIPLLTNYTTFASRPARQLRTIFNCSPSNLNRSSDHLSACLHALRGTVDYNGSSGGKHVRHMRERTSSSSSLSSLSQEDKYVKLSRPRSLNEVLEELDEGDALGLRDFINSVRSESIMSGAQTERLLKSVANLAQRIHDVALDIDVRSSPVLDTSSDRQFMMTSWAIAYTVQSYERVARFKGAPLFEDLESSRSLCLSSLLHFACLSMMRHHSDTMQSLLVRKLRYLLINEDYLSSSPCCLDVDAVEMLGSLLILIQKLYVHEQPSGQQQQQQSLLDLSLGGNKSPQGQRVTRSAAQKVEIQQEAAYSWATRVYDHEYYRNLLHLMLILNLVQVIVALQNEQLLGEEQQDEDCHMSSTESEREEADATEQECQAFRSFHELVVIASGHPHSRIPQINQQYLCKARRRLLPFLRSCAVFFQHLSQIAPPDVLRFKSAFFEGKHFAEHPRGQSATKNQSSCLDEEEFVDATEDPAELHEPRRSSVASKNEQDEDENQDEETARATNDEFNAICQYLDLPTSFSSLLESQEVRHLARGWLRHSRVLELIKSATNREPEKQQDMPKLRRAASSSRLPGGSISAAGAMASPPSLTAVSSRATLTSSCELRGQPAADLLMPLTFIRQPHSVNRLIELPHDYSELVDKVSDFTCPSIKNEGTRTPTMCLVCGAMLCSQSYCCQRDLNDLANNYQLVMQLRQQHQEQNPNEPAASRSPSLARAALELVNAGVVLAMPANLIRAAAAEQTAAEAQHFSSASIHSQLVGSCTYHAHECSGGVGVFLRIRNCQLLLLNGRSKGCYMPAPYIDDHGETDFGLQRGNPLHLNKQLYERMQNMWLTHSIPEQISRTLEYSSYASSINWHLH